MSAFPKRIHGLNAALVKIAMNIFKEFDQNDSKIHLSK